MGAEWVVLDNDQPGLSPPRWALLPQHAWLDGTVLVVERGGVLSRCDLATATRMTLKFQLLGGFLVLRAYEGDGVPPVELAVECRRWQLLVNTEALRLLAQVIGTRLGWSSRIARELRSLADAEDRRTTPVDWSFRTDPRGLRSRRV